MVKGIQEYHDYRLIHLSRSKYFSLNNKTHLDRSKLDRCTLDRILAQQTVVMVRSKGEQLYCLEVSLTFLGHSSHNPPVVSSRRYKKDYSDEKKI